MKLKILGKRWTVENVESDILQELGADGACLSKSRILIAANLTDDEYRETLIHELLHAIWAGMDIGYSESTEEKVVSALAKGIAAFVVDNDADTVRAVLS